MATPAMNYQISASSLWCAKHQLIRNGTISIVDGKIAEINTDGNKISTTCDHRIILENVLLIPGLVNAHTHLEFSHLERPLGSAGMSLPDWIRLVIANRQQQQHNVADAIRQGITESLQCGVTSLGQITVQDHQSIISNIIDDQPNLDITNFLELIGLSAARLRPLLEAAKSHLQIDSAENINRLAGISPHAPYTVSLDLVQQVVDLFGNHAPIAMHLAESPEEIELLQSGSGKFVPLLEDFGVWQDDLIPPNTRPIDYLRRLAKATHSLIIHGNYLDEAEIEFIARHSKNMSVVYCPRTHEYFQHPRYPLPEMLAARVNIALGTDSRASNPDLNLLSEMKLMAMKFPEVTACEIFKSATLSGAIALGQSQKVGSLEHGKQANLAIIQLSENDGDDLLRSVLTSAAKVIATIYQGKIVYDELDLFSSVAGK